MMRFLGVEVGLAARFGGVRFRREFRPGTPTEAGAMGKKFFLAARRSTTPFGPRGSSATTGL